jgi:hypothetical protein
VVLVVVSVYRIGSEGMLAIQVLKRLTSSETRRGVGSRGNDVKAGERVGSMQFTRRAQKGIGQNQLRTGSRENKMGSGSDCPSSVCGGGRRIGFGW